MSLSTEDRLKRRKLDALRRGIHRVTGSEALPIGTHIVGIGKAGAGVIAETLRTLEPGAPKLVALAVDIGEGSRELRELAASLPPDRAELITLTLPVPGRDLLFETLRKYPDYLTLEYPSHRSGGSREPWLPPAVDIPAAGHFRRAVAKAIYGCAYYGGARMAEQALRAFAASVDAANAQAMVAVVFGMGGGTGSGIAVDLVRHLSSRVFGRRILVAGIAMAPCEGDLAEHRGTALFPLLNELDCLGDEAKNQGIVASGGELFRNPFTAGVIVVPQQHVWEATKDLAATQLRGNQEIASLLTRRSGANAWELLRLLNWVAAPSTQHSAARTPWGPRWVHMLAYADMAGPVAIGPRLRAQIGLLPGYVPEFVEMRVADAAGEDAARMAATLGATLLPEVPPHVVGNGREGSVQFVLPCMSKLDLSLFFAARRAYGDATMGERLLDHSLLLDQGVLLCEPSTRLQGMAGASLDGGTGWVAVPFGDLQGGEEPLPAARAA